MNARKTGVLPLGAQGAGLLVCVIAALATAGIAPAWASQAIVVALGASQTAGKGVDPDEAYPAQLEAMLRARGKDVRVINAGINGDTTGGMLARLDADVPNGTRVVILQPGTNDKIAGERNHNAETITARLRARGIAVILIEHTGRTVPSTMRQADGQHLTEAGYRLLASSLLPRVLAALGR